MKRNWCNMKISSRSRVRLTVRDIHLFANYYDELGNELPPFQFGHHRDGWNKRRPLLMRRCICVSTEYGASDEVE